MYQLAKILGVQNTPVIKVNKIEAKSCTYKAHGEGFLQFENNLSRKSCLAGPKNFLQNPNEA